MTKVIIFFCIFIGTAATAFCSCVSDYLKNNSSPISSTVIIRSRSIKVQPKTMAHGQSAEIHKTQYPELIVDLSLDPNIDTTKHNFEEEKKRQLYEENNERIKKYLKDECRSLNVFTRHKIISRLHILMIRSAVDFSQKIPYLQEFHTQAQKNALVLLHAITNPPQQLTQPEQVKQFTAIRSPVELKIYPFPTVPDSKSTPDAMSTSMDTSEEFSPVFQKR